MNDTVNMPPMLMAVQGTYHLELRRANGDVEFFSEGNLIVDEGLDETLDVMFGGAGQATTWYLGVFAGNYTPVAGVAAATIAAAATESSDYAAGTRPEWQDAAAASQSKTNSANRASFVFNATTTIYGAFLVSSNVKQGTGGVLFSASRFSTAKAVDSGDELLLTYVINSASA